MGKVITIANQKGGVGKSTIAINLAGYLSKSANVFLIDMDPQETITDWNNVRKKNNSIKNINLHISNKPYMISDIKENIDRLDKEYDIVVIDTPPEDDKIMRLSLAVSDYAIIPIQPSPFDIRSAYRTAGAIKDGIDRKLINIKIRVLISRKMSGTVIGRDTQKTLKDFIFPVLKSEICQRIAITEAGIDGRTIFEYAPGSKAAGEFIKLGKEIRKWIKKQE